MELTQVDSNGCWLWTGALCGKGYGQFTFPGGRRAHRAAWAMFHGQIPKGMQVLHNCDVMRCVNPDHLFLGTHQDNMTDMKAKGRRKGITPRLPDGRPTASKIHPEDVVQIRQLVASGSMQKDVAKKFGITRSTVGNICARRLWRSIE